MRVIGLLSFLVASTAARSAAAVDLRYTFRGDTLIDAIAVGLLVSMGVVLAAFARRRSLDS